MDLNRVFIAGNLTRDPEKRYLPSGNAVTSFSLAINNRYKNKDGELQEEVTFVDCTVFGAQAETAGDLLVKGSNVFVDGRLKLYQWTDSACCSAQSTHRTEEEQDGNLCGQRRGKPTNEGSNMKSGAVRRAREEIENATSLPVLNGTVKPGSFEVPTEED